MTRNGSDVCITCVMSTLSDDCLVVIVPVTSTFTQPPHKQDDGICYSFLVNGTYYIYGHDIGSLRPAVVKEYVIDWIPIPVSSLSSQY